MDLRIYVHSFNIRLLGLICYMLNGEMRFYYVGDEKCMSRSQAEALQREFLAVLHAHIMEPNDRAGEIPVSLQAATQ